LSIHGECFDREGNCFGCSILEDGKCQGEIEDILVQIVNEDEDAALELAELYDKKDFLIKYLKELKGEKQVNKTIVKIYTKTKDAILIEKHFGNKFEDKSFPILLKGKEADLLTEAERLEKIENDNKEE